MKGYEWFPHTADVALLIRGKDLKELLLNGAKGLFSLITDRRRIRKKLKTELAVCSDTRETLLIQWMGELLFLHDAKGLLFGSFFVEEIRDNSLKALAFGETFDEARHPIKTQVKAVTYHGIKIEEHNGILRALVVLDV